MPLSDWILQIPPLRWVNSKITLQRARKVGRDLASQSNSQLRERNLNLRFRAKSGEKLTELLPEAIALVCESSHRILGMKHYDVQLLAGIHLASKCIVEMATGEGKTLTAMLPLYLNALAGKGAHLATANDYLAKRDAETTQPVFEALGMTVGVIQNLDSDSDRLRAYKCDVTYGTCAEFGFDFLRDRMKRRALTMSNATDIRGSNSSAMQPVCRKMNFILVDEADSVMIDDASTPLIIGAISSTQKEKVTSLYRWSATHAPRARETIEFVHIDHRGKIELTEPGRTWVRETARKTEMATAASVDLYEYMERAIKVERDYHRDRNYVVSGGEVTIVDNNTGRLAVGRNWQEGIHQAIQAREQMDITVPTTSAAQLTIQSLILSYPLRAGMTGTARPSRREFRKVFKMGVIRIPTRLPSRRKRWATIYCPNEREKMLAIREEVIKLQSQGRPVLIGSRSVKKSELISEIFAEVQVPHVVLNARFEDREAEIVERAGEPERVTISTSMSGRGTDIKLDETVCQRGGLHVIIAELNDSARIDRQLIGRCARQGDPGTFRYFLCPEDHVLDSKNRTEFWGRLIKSLPLVPRHWLFKAAQSQLNSKNVRDRLGMLHSEKSKLRALKLAGLDPVLDVVG